MFGFIKKLFGKSESVNKTLEVSNDPEINSLFWQLLHDKSLNLAAQVDLAAKIDELFNNSMDFSNDFTPVVKLSEEKEKERKKMYREGVVLLHPDLYKGNLDEASVRNHFQNFQEAYDSKDLPLMRTLLNDAKRRDSK